jgi:Salmonella virulence plasmid 65kDa B protein
MGNNSSDSAQIIAMPKGGGALQGIGEKFSPDLHTSTGNFTISIAIAPGRNGFQSQISLVYSTGTGSESFGPGWNLMSPGAVARALNAYDDGNDVRFPGDPDHHWWIRAGVLLSPNGDDTVKTNSSLRTATKRYRRTKCPIT